MKKILLGSVATGALMAAGSANAADLGTRPVYKAPPVVAPIPTFSWTGCFVGAHGGWGWGRKDIHEHATFSSASAFSGSNSADTSGAIFGGQVGCDYQFSSNFVVGIQGDLAGARLTSDRFCDPSFCEPTGSSGLLQVRTDWLASVTARVGVTGWLPRTLLYVRGGVAWVKDRWTFTDVDGLGVGASNSEPAESSVFTQTRTGWTIGGGIEYAVAPNWSVFAEFNHYDFGTKNLFHGATTSGSTRTFDISTTQRIESVRVGVNYRFNFGKATPVVARY
jgi:outer membrane immunogenic protein